MKQYNQTKNKLVAAKNINVTETYTDIAPSNLRHFAMHSPNTMQ